MDFVDLDSPYENPYLDIFNQFYNKQQKEEKKILVTLFLSGPSADCTCGITESMDSTARVLCLSRPVEWMTRREQCELLRIWCASGGILQGVLSALRINRVWVELIN